MDGPLGALVDRVRGGDRRAWTGSVEELLYDGEQVRHRVDVDGSRVVVTTHRLLAFTPEGAGENFQQVDRPNVDGVSAGHDGEDNLLVQGARVLVYGVVLLAVGLFVDFGSFVPTDMFGQAGAAGSMGLSGLLGLLQSFTEVLAQADQFARIVGAVLLLFAVFVFAVYLLTRDRVLVVSVAGGEDITVPASGGIETAVAELEDALFE
jgi:hypothetical protein